MAVGIVQHKLLKAIRYLSQDAASHFSRGNGASYLSIVEINKGISGPYSKMGSPTAAPKIWNWQACCACPKPLIDVLQVNHYLCQQCTIGDWSHMVSECCLPFNSDPDKDDASFRQIQWAYLCNRVVCV